MPKQRDNSGVLFKNKDKTKEEQPHAKGRAMIDGVEYWLSAWRNVTESGEVYTAIKFKRKETDAPGTKPDTAKPAPPDDDSTPF